MKNYIGTKKVQAEPMNECEAFGANLTRERPADRDWKEGYKVVYEDGYESWSPKDVFEKAYKIADTFVDRLKIEAEELADRLRKLDDLLANENKLDKLDKFLLFTQRDSMSVYYRILLERLRWIDMREEIKRINSEQICK